MSTIITFPPHTENQGKSSLWVATVVVLLLGIIAAAAYVWTGYSIPIATKAAADAPTTAASGGYAPITDTALVAPQGTSY